MAKTLELSLGPFRYGVDNRHDVYESEFQPGPPETGYRTPDRCSAASNLDFDDDGWWQRRVGTTNRRTGTAYKNLVSCAGLLLVQDGGSIYTIDPDASFAVVEAVSGLNATAKVDFHEFNDECYYTNGYVCGKITSAGVAAYWGLTNPATPTLGTTAGDLTAGRYIVACTLVDSNGLESGTYNTAAQVLDGTTDLTVTVSSPDSNATHVNIYVSPVDQEGLFWNQKVAVGSLPATITADRGISTRPLRTQMLRGPIAADGLSSYLGYMFLWVDNVLFRSRGQVPHLFHPRSELLTFPFNVRTVLGLQDGFYVATEKTLHWVSGERPAVWRNVQIGRGAFAVGGTVRPGREIPGLQTESLVALLASEAGLIAGLPGGRVVHLTSDRLKLDSAPATADILYIERDELRQIFMLLN